MLDVGCWILDFGFWDGRVDVRWERGSGTYGDEGVGIYVLHYGGLF
jgi:hypothetical protein